MLFYMVRTSVLPLPLYLQQIPHYTEFPVVKTTWTVKMNVFFDTTGRIYFVQGQ